MAKTVQLTTHQGWWEFSPVLVRLQPFRTHGALRGDVMDGYWSSTGRLPSEWVQRIRNEQPDYVVFSYGTPIAWHSEKDGWTKPPLKYSITTTRHQSLVFTAIDNPNGSSLIRELREQGR